MVSTNRRSFLDLLYTCVNYLDGVNIDVEVTFFLIFDLDICCLQTILRLTYNYNCCIIIIVIEKLQEVSNSTTGIMKTVSTWTKSEAAAYWDSMEYTKEQTQDFNIARDFPLTYCMAQVVLHQVHKKLGFDRCTDYLVSAAPMDLKVIRYFASLDIPIMELFGQSECTGPHTINTIRAFQFGTVGRPMLGTETKIDPATGEMLYRGRHIFAGYVGLPEKTNETIDQEGWLHSGDIAIINNDSDDMFPTGFVSITGRIKELIITAGGENIAPTIIESQLKAAMPALSNAMVIGDQRKFLTVLLSVQVEVDADGNATGTLTRRALETSHDIGSTATTTTDVMKCLQWKKYFNNGIQTANTFATSQAQNIGKWTLIPTDFTEKGGELTPTLKLKRSVTATKYATYIEAMYH
jgi:long-chain-fatty-acid--CoA ligase ACSBG